VTQSKIKFSAGFVEPMLCAPVKYLPEGPGWEYELKLDGYRPLALKSEGGTSISQLSISSDILGIYFSTRENAECPEVTFLIR
jgi:hypothetical protein